MSYTRSRDVDSILKGIEKDATYLGSLIGVTRRMFKQPVNQHTAGFTLEVVQPDRARYSEYGWRLGGMVDPVFSAVVDIDQVLTAAGEQIPGILSDARLSPEGKAQLYDSLLAKTEADVARLVDGAQRVADEVIAEVNKKGRPVRPFTSSTVEQEAQLAGIKADVKMLLDPLSMRDGAGSTSPVAKELAAELERRIAADDKLAVWLLASSDWVDLYLRSRCAGNEEMLTLVRSAYEAAVSGVIVDTGSDEVKLARVVHDALTGPQGLKRTLMLLSSWSSAHLNAMRQNRPAA